MRLQQATLEKSLLEKAKMEEDFYMDFNRAINKYVLEAEEERRKKEEERMLKEEERRLKEEERMQKEEERRLKEEERMQKEEERRLKEEERRLKEEALKEMEALKLELALLKQKNNDK